jgi:hypothetical protein
VTRPLSVRLCNNCMIGGVMARWACPAHHERMGGIGTERREVEFEPLPDESVQEPREQPAPTEPVREPAPA